jgi:hypothetical protein
LGLVALINLFAQGPSRRRPPGALRVLRRGNGQVNDERREAMSTSESRRNDAEERNEEITDETVPDEQRQRPEHERDHTGAETAEEFSQRSRPEAESGPLRED